MADAWDESVDVLVAGTGAAGLTAAITAADRGLRVLVVESTPRWGGTTAISGGGLWMPGNPLARQEGFEDSAEDALLYMRTVIGDVGPASSVERRQAFLDAVPEVYGLLERLGARWVRAADYPDYYPDRPGARIGRTLEFEPVDTEPLGAWMETARAKDGFPLPIKTDDVWLLARAWSTPGGFARGARFAARAVRSLLAGRREFGMGGALSTGLMRIVLDQKTPVRLRTPLVDLIQEDGAVVGAVVRRDGTHTRVRAERGVVLAAGGFAANSEWRQKHHGIPGWTSAPEGDLGTAIDLGRRAGAALALMDDAWWGATVKLPEERGHGFVLWERSFPYSMVVDSTGVRYTNESASYVDFGHAMLERDRTVPAVPSWLVTDARHARRYLRTYVLSGGGTKKFLASGEMVRGRTVPELAVRMGVDPRVLRDSVARFNGFARTGVDEDFGRGATAYDRYYSDPGVTPNPNLGAIAKGPFTAVKLYPGDLGTKGGLLTDADARVVREDGGVIPGLYAAGNTTASVMGRTYPGAGATIAPAMAFGYRAAAHLAGRVP
ncbi:3-oxosteroid 1-dehydrogenase [Virgisporangium aliadipatigenens]|uniref:3-oxosteroid 1-dehydrogenase n=1 Tax=Virgisporangium aliadipatigenens TaxID=741659 RepID=A0A8J4DPQ8_9ACTN|nr:FAD-dependent oxidoreductase [Virgisporangium aliadipatigenens]GIJ45176.1 3-oxosteroid 1-dehydrogenase [Virgisporangium aliadipatigenens]